MIYVNVADSILSSDDFVMIDQLFLQRAANETLCFLNQKEKLELTILLTDDIQTRDLNRSFRGIDDPTDVLAFPSGNSDPDPENESLYLGDVVISYQRARIQAGIHGHSMDAELQLLVVHGVLHLLGYDHSEPDARAAMFSIQDDVIRALEESVQPRER